MVKLIFSGKIAISFPWDLPEKFSGPTVMFDVNSASHNIAYLSAICELYVVSKDNVWKALDIIKDAVLVGESDDPELKKKFYARNSASEIIKADLKNQKVILITNNGTKTINEIWDKGASPIIACDYANLHTVANWLIENYMGAAEITLVPAGGREAIYSPDPNLLEDLICAQAMADLLKGKVPDLKSGFDRSIKYIHKTNPISSPSGADLQELFTTKDKFRTVPVCFMHKNGILEIRDLINKNEKKDK